ncbi:MAG TPA: amidohydrolase family protein [Planctomycetota bacterium]|nr:amidohydrolase family protein [Planctomycetota bacterium]HJM40256.1 amidohydrolase family protein [Planctomycetota bacterium]
MRTLSTLFLSLTLSVSLFAQGESVALRVGKIVQPDGRTMENATVLVENGRISAVGGVDLELPFDVLLREFPDATLFPGFCEVQTSSGTDRANENVPVAPFLNVKDSIDPVAYFYEDELRGGTVAIGVIPGNNCVIGGLGRVVAPSGMTVEAMTLSSDMGMKIAFGPKSRWNRGAQLAELRESIDNLNRDLKKLGKGLVEKGARESDLRSVDEEVEEKQDDGDSLDNAGGYIRFGEDYEGKELISEEDVSETQRGLVDILNGDHRLWLWTPTPTDIVHARAWLANHGLEDSAVFVVTAQAWKAASELKEAGRPVALSGGLWHIERDPMTWEEKKTFAPKAFLDAGVAVAISSNKSRLGPDRLAYQAATCVREGMSRREAMAAVTSLPAAAWGLGDRIGRIAEGRDGSFVLLDGDPLDIRSRVLGVWVKGARVYDRSTDERLQRLEEGRQK